MGVTFLQFAISIAEQSVIAAERLGSLSRFDRRILRRATTPRGAANCMQAMSARLQNRAQSGAMLPRRSGCPALLDIDIGTGSHIRR